MTDNDFNDVSLQEFFARPIKIAAWSWVPGSPFFSGSQSVGLVFHN